MEDINTLILNADSIDELSTFLPPWNSWNVSENDTFDYVPYSARPETYIVPVLFAVIFVIGVLGNGTLIVIFMKHRSMRNVPNMYLVSLGISDLMVIVFVVPFTSTLYSVESWPYGELICKFSEFIKDMSIGVSVFTLTALSADRYSAIANPMRKRRATKITCITIAGIWMLSILFAMPSALFSYVKVMDQDPTRVFYICYPFPEEFGDKYPQVIVMFHFLAYYAIPLVLIATFYIGMARHLVLSTKNMPGESQGQGKQMQSRRKVAKMILSFVVIFMICFMPSHAFLLWFYFYPDSENAYNDFWHACRITGFCLAYINSCINPITLYCVSGTFRKQYNEHLFCCCSRRKGTRQSGRAQVIIRQPGLACGCSLNGQVPPYPQARGAQLGLVPNAARNGHGHGFDQRHHPNFREQDQESNFPAVCQGQDRADGNSNGNMSPWSKRQEGTRQISQEIEIPLTHKAHKSTKNNFVDNQNC